MKKTVFFLLLVAGLFSCIENKTKIESNHLMATKKIVDSLSKSIDCDSIYPEKGIHVSLIEQEHSDELNAHFLIFKNGKVIVDDRLYSSVFAVEFEDFNGDGILDILIPNSSDARSNWTYYLYLASADLNSFQRIKGFEQIKNPDYFEEHDLITCLVMSGTDWSAFYEIKKDSIHDFGVVAYMDEDHDYGKEFDVALKKVLRIRGKN